eukprot:TRINITY_DN6833_c0_g1_i1.p1 TRINITY_DN6833_c0_g1~~TRINITY_DN6833_c0_g1_i1.p1  ORF type:complete len:281 (+),score=25.78 TRINITY_DN6833_c0_g1_i1:60-845(+)
MAPVEILVNQAVPLAQAEQKVSIQSMPFKKTRKCKTGKWKSRRTSRCVLYLDHCEVESEDVVQREYIMVEECPQAETTPPVVVEDKAVADPPKQSESPPVVEPPEQSSPLCGLPLVARLSSVLEHMAQQNGTEGTKPTVFHSKRKVPGTFYDYMGRLHQYFQCSDACFILALAYMDRLGRNQADLNVNDLTFHRLMLTSLVVAAKYHDDVYYSNRYYAKVGGVSVKELGCLETAFLTCLSFSVHVPLEQYQTYATLIGGRA